MFIELLYLKNLIVYISDHYLFKSCTRIFNVYNSAN